MLCTFVLIKEHNDTFYDFSFHLILLLSVASLFPPFVLCSIFSLHQISPHSCSKERDSEKGSFSTTRKLIEEEEKLRNQKERRKIQQQQQQ